MANSPSTSDTTDATMSLEERIQRLAQELQDMVFECYMHTMASEQNIDINTAYQPPKQLQINRATRQTAAKRYYSTNTFIIGGIDMEDLSIAWTGSGIPDHERFDRASATVLWLRSLTADHSFMIETLSVPQPIDYYEAVDIHSDLFHWHGYYMDALEKSSEAVLQPCCLKIAFSIEAPNGPNKGENVVVSGRRDELPAKTAAVVAAMADIEALMNEGED
ncbi:hypothetical protein AC578_10428 [Pseudocercospora eumusae]|uniref:Uncharacterized protein n=1 Tax=Pseudocercospora eumusae TaxID=321146 RepID=A0A139HBD4_9PEZI|nr:hypothetical protein AC578_10428 [Pseudocercospora eumusae]